MFHYLWRFHETINKHFDFVLSPFQGFESLEDLEKNADLTFQQKIGIKHYDDINQKMPREEVAEIEKHVRVTKNLFRRAYVCSEEKGRLNSIHVYSSTLLFTTYIGSAK